MSELPRTDDLPRAEEGYDPDRVEEAFASFGDRVRELEAIAAELRAELRSLRAQRSVALAASETDPEWPAEHSLTEDGLGASPDWIAAAVPPPVQRPLAVPRLAVEALFLLLVALFAGLADLEPEWIVLLMGAAWVVVALVEWTAAARRARWRLDEIPPPLEPAGDTTGRWSSPVVEATALAQPDVSESRTVVTKLPPAPDVAPEPPPEPDDATAGTADDTAEDTAETSGGHAPAETPEEPAQQPRRRFFRRRHAEEPAPADLEET
jgi:hypothetical protein